MPEQSPTEDPWLSFGVLEEQTKPSKPPSKQYRNKVNAYFLLDLRLPASPRHHGNHGNTFPSALRTPYNSPSKLPPPPPSSDTSQPSSSDTSIRKFGFLQLLERIHGKDLTTNNPWLNPYADPRPDRAQFEREVRFTTTEMLSPELPHCRRDVGGMTVKPGQIHATTCPNAAHETVEVLGEHAWQNREFILENTKPRDKSRARAHAAWKHHHGDAESPCDHHGNGEQSGGSVEYHKAEAGSLEELGVKDSLELTKRRLHLANDPQNRETDSKNVSLQKEQQTCDCSPEICRQNLLHPDFYPNMLLELRSPGASDEEAITPANTLIQSDSCYSDSTEDSVFSSASSSQETKKDRGSKEEKLSSSSSLNHSNEFDMVATPPFRKGTSDYGSSGSDFRVRELDDTNEGGQTLTFVRDKKPSTPYPTNVLKKQLEEETFQEEETCRNEEGESMNEEDKTSINDSLGDIDRKSSE